jgi:hypothetical protein
MPNEKFSLRFSEWLSSKKPKTLQNLIDKFQEKSFAILFLLLMATPALPLPTGGISHVFELIVLLLSLELIIGRRTVWLPKRWLKLTLPKKFEKAALKPLLKLILKAEKYSRPRLSKLLDNSLLVRVLGLVVFTLTLFAFLAPPFSGLDTLPALGVVFISLALILEDYILGVIGLIVGLVGAGIVLTLGSLVFRLI